MLTLALMFTLCFLSTSAYTQVCVYPYPNFKDASHTGLGHAELQYDLILANFVWNVPISKCHILNHTKLSL